MLYRHREVLLSMVVKNVKAKYVGSLLGIWWSIITPLLIMAAITFVFTVIWPVSIKLFSLFVLCGILPWIFFASALSESTNSLIENTALLHQYIVPKELIPLATVLSNFINFLFGLVCIIPFFIIFKLSTIQAIGWLPLVLFFHFVFVCGFSLLLSSINVYIRDVGHILGTFLMFWFWVTPVFYSHDMIPLPWKSYLLLNPMTSYVESYRQVLYRGFAPDIRMLLFLLFWSVSIFVLGYSVFIKLESNFIKKL
ncbi:MAG: ABC transporter permease [Candidatus Omnitrophica bacterium]|nr:ABC transporter permease [Candidatus Omnitrophota bacterium]